MHGNFVMGLAWVGVLVASGLAHLSGKIVPLSIALIASNVVGLIGYIRANAPQE